MMQTGNRLTAGSLSDEAKLANIYSIYSFIAEVERGKIP
jgi:hypothetical protein